MKTWDEFHQNCLDNRYTACGQECFLKKPLEFSAQLRFDRSKDPDHEYALTKLQLGTTSGSGFFQTGQVVDIDRDEAIKLRDTLNRLFPSRKG